MAGFAAKPPVIIFSFVESPIAKSRLCFNRCLVTPSLTKNLGKPATASVSAKADETPKKSTDKAPEGVKKDNASGSDEESGKKKPSRSVSRKRASLFGSLLSRREDAEAKKEGEDAKAEEPAPSMSSIR